MDLSPFLAPAFEGTELRADLDRLEDAIERAVFAGLDEAAQRTAAAARASHWYRNRTGDLERSTLAQPAEGSAWDDTASSSVVALTDYAPFVDARAPILAPAWALVQPTVEQLFEYQLLEACRG